MEFKILQHEFSPVYTPEHYPLAEMRLEGRSVAEIARTQGMSKKRVRGLLSELHQVYLRLFP